MENIYIESYEKHSKLIDKGVILLKKGQGISVSEFSYLQRDGIIKCKLNLIFF